MYDVADGLGTLSMILRLSGDAPAALDAFRQGIRAWGELGHVGMLPVVKLGAKLELAVGNPDRAARLAVLAKRAAEQLGGELPVEMTGVEDPLEEARAVLSEDDFERAVAEASAMTYDEAFAYAAGETAPEVSAR
jgi:hypothetical protein